MIVYIAGPFRASTPWVVEHNVRKAEGMSLRLWKAGIANITPHLLGRNFDKEIPDDIVLEGMKKIMLKCDAVLVIDGWKGSRGTIAEVSLASEFAIPVFYADRQEDRARFDAAVGTVFGYETAEGANGQILP